VNVFARSAWLLASSGVNAVPRGCSGWRPGFLIMQAIDSKELVIGEISVSIIFIDTASLMCRLIYHTVDAGPSDIILPNYPSHLISYYVIYSHVYAPKSATHPNILFPDHAECTRKGQEQKKMYSYMTDRLYQPGPVSWETVKDE